MKYTLKDRLEEFEFHDSEWKLISWEQDLIFSAHAVNLHRSMIPESPEKDLQLAEARITLSGFEIKELIPSRTFRKNENGEWVTDEPLVVYTGEAAKNVFIEELKHEIRVLIWEQNKAGIYELRACGIDPFLSVNCTFTSSLVEWDAYKGEAWYERS